LSIVTSDMSTNMQCFRRTGMSSAPGGLHDCVRSSAVAPKNWRTGAAMRRSIAAPVAIHFGSATGRNTL
jgi:hypothetical protein